MPLFHAPHYFLQFPKRTCPFQTILRMGCGPDSLMEPKIEEKALRHCILHAESKILGAGVIVVFKIDYRRLRNADGVEIAVAGGEIRAVRTVRH